MVEHGVYLRGVPRRCLYDNAKVVTLVRYE